MSGAYCKFCDHRCFVERVLPDASWRGHMATCPGGMEWDRRVLGFDSTTAVNPQAKSARLFEGLALPHLDSGEDITDVLVAQAVLAERERIAQAISKEEKKIAAAYRRSASTYDEGYRDALDIAEQIARTGGSDE